MLKKIDFYYFSPTGGTKNAGKILAEAMGENINYIDLGKDGCSAGRGELAIIAAPVFAGRIPEMVCEKLRAIGGRGTKAVTLAVYGVRAYEDALLELNDVASDAGFDVVGSAALIARHSMMPEVGAGRPDAQDAAEISDFGKKLLEKLSGDKVEGVDVPGSRPYRAPGVFDYTPLCNSACTLCSACIAVCPVGAIDFDDDGLVTDVDTCFMCLACVAACPRKARVMPADKLEFIHGKLGGACKCPSGK